jgi:hypothetical protein
MTLVKRSQRGGCAPQRPASCQRQHQRKPLQQIVLLRRGSIELANQALGRVDRQVAIGGESDGQQLLPILNPAGAHDAIAIRQAEDPIAGGEALFDQAIAAGVLLWSAGALVRRLLGLALVALAAQPLDQRVGVGRALIVGA